MPLRFLVGVLLILVASAPAQIQAPGTVGWSIVEVGQNSAITTEQQNVFQTEGQFITWWKQHSPGTNAPMNKVNFNTQFVVAITLGQRRTGGYSVAIADISKNKKGEVQVTYMERQPTGITTEALTSPYVVVAIKRTSGNVVFSKLITKDTTSQGTFLPVWRTFVSEQNGGGSRAMELLITDAESLRAHYKNVLKESCPTDIDFSRESLVAIHLGTMPSTGYDVLIDSIYMDYGRLCVNYVVRTPSQGQHVKRTLTSPYTLIRIPAVNAPVSFNRRSWAGDGR